GGEKWVDNSGESSFSGSTSEVTAAQACAKMGHEERGQVHFLGRKRVRLPSSLYNHDLGRSGQIMELLTLVRIQTIIGLTCALVVLYFQVRAYRRHKKT